MTKLVLRYLRGTWLPIVTGALLLVLISVTGAQATSGPEPGPYRVGFKTLEKYDHTRAFRPKKDYFGELIPGERARPIQTCIWYPAEVAADDMTMVYGEYGFPYPEDEAFIEFLSNIQNRENGVLFVVLNNDRGRVLDLMSVPLEAVRDVPPLAGPFPLIIYHPHWQTGITENLILCEYLASYGFVVASTHPLGTHSLATTGSASDIESMVRDKEFLLGELRGETYIDPNKLGVLGAGSGGTTALLMQMRNSDIEAVAAVIGSFADSSQLEQIRHNPYYDNARALVPLLHVYSTVEETDLSLWESLKYTPRYAVELTGPQLEDFANYGLLAPDEDDTTASPLEVQAHTYRTTCMTVRDFFQAILNQDEESLARLQAPPEAKSDPDFLTFTFAEGQDVPPTRQQFVNIIQGGQVDEAVELFDKFRKQDPELLLFPEAALNMLGYRFLQRGNADHAVALFRMTAESYPNSANVWDSLADGYLGQGNNEKAMECYRQVLEVLPDDSNIGEDLKTTLRNNAEQGIERLSQ